jgi:5-methylcytosine-specific restriction endonuclease McrA
MPKGNAPARPCKHPDGCPRDATRQGWCEPHYRHVRKTGEPGPVQIRLRINDWEKAYWARVERRGPGECWLWTGLKTKGGYGIYWPKGGNTGESKDGVQRTTAHRIAYELLIGPIPEGLTLDHVEDRCSSRLCCNPAHLEPVTRGENNLRGNSPAAKNARKTHCDQGHEFTPENTYITPGSGKRRCRVCTYERYLSSTRTDQEAILAEFGMVCHLCGGAIESPDDLQFDHVIPISRGGARLEGNVLPSHKRCNNSKGNNGPGQIALF